MREITKEAKTVESAIEIGLKELGCEKEEAEIEILQEPIKGIFGLAKMAKVKIKTQTGESMPAEKSRTHEIEEEIDPQEIQKVLPIGNEVLKQMLELMGMQQVVTKASIEESAIILDIHSDSEGLLIGRHGQTLASLQYLVNKILYHKTGLKVRCIIDVDGYRAKHKMILEKMAKRIAKKVMETKEEEELQSMNAFDRRIIHLCIQDNPEVTSYSLGEGNFRRVVIAPRNKVDQ